MFGARYEPTSPEGLAMIEVALAGSDDAGAVLAFWHACEKYRRPTRRRALDEALAGRPWAPQGS